MESSLALLVRNWFCSINGKDFCDPEGGALTVSSTALLDVAKWLSRSQLTDRLRLSSRRSPARIAETNTSTALCGWCVETAAGELFPELRSTFFFGRAWGCQGALLQRAELRALQQRQPCLLCHPICASGASLMLKTKFYISTDTLTTHSVLRQTNVLMILQPVYIAGFNPNSK